MYRPEKSESKSRDLKLTEDDLAKNEFTYVRMTPEDIAWVIYLGAEIERGRTSKEVHREEKSFRKNWRENIWREASDE